MRKFFVCLLGLLLFSSVAMAQQFSSSLGGGGSGAGYNNRSSAVNQPSKKGYGDVKKAYNRKKVKKTVLRYSPAQTGVDDAQEEQIMPIIRRIQEGETKRLEIVGIAKEYSAAYHRMNALRLLFIGYTNVIPSFRHITGGSVFNSNDNTVEIYEYY